MLHGNIYYIEMDWKDIRWYS